MAQLMTTKDVAKFLNVNEKMVYSLVSEKGLPATKVTGKWLFPRHLVEQWIETHTTNYPDAKAQLPPYDGLLIITGSNDPLFEKAVDMFNRAPGGHVAVFGNLGSMGGLRALRQNRCHIATSHLLQDDEKEYNFDYASQELPIQPAVVNFCRREQGLVVAKGNPKGISAVADLGRPGLKIVNRPLGTGTRLLLDRELKKAGLKGEKIEGYTREMRSHLNVGLEILAGRADLGPAVRVAAGLLNLDFIPLRWERYDMMVLKERFFEEGVQRFMGILHERAFRNQAREMPGYDLSSAGKMIFPGNGV
ncbi:MAG: helix-turn-helix transcriptional regulator [Desulfobacterales bacterium]